MANYANLKAAIDAVIKANGQQEITGPLLNQVLKAMVNALGAGYLFMGIAEHDTNPNTPDQNVFYIALEEGTYTHFGNAQVHFGISLLFWYGQWSVYNLVTFSNTVTDEVEEIPTSYAVFNALKDAAVYDVTAHTGQRFANLNSLLSSPDIDTLIPSSVRKAGMTIMFTSPAHAVQQPSQLFKHKFFFNAVDMSQITNVNRWIGIETTVTQNSLNVPTSGAVFAAVNTARVDTIAEAGVFDVTANNDGATFASLSALLNDEDLNTLIPVARRRGGMSIKYVSTSDNKYVQYRYIGTATTGTPNPFLDTSNWQEQRVSQWWESIVPFDLLFDNNKVSFSEIAVKKVGESGITRLFPNQDHSVATFTFTTGTNQYLVIHLDSTFQIITSNANVLEDDCILLRWYQNTLIGGELYQYLVAQNSIIEKVIIPNGLEYINEDTIKLTSIRVLFSDGTDTGQIYVDQSHEQQTLSLGNGRRILVLTNNLEIVTRGTLSNVLHNDIILLAHSSTEGFSCGELYPSLNDIRLDNFQNLKKVHKIIASGLGFNQSLIGHGDTIQQVNLHLPVGRYICHCLTPNYNVSTITASNKFCIRPIINGQYDTPLVQIATSAQVHSSYSFNVESTWDATALWIRADEGEEVFFMIEKLQSTTYSGITHLIPDNEGQLNAVKRARQMTDIEWTPSFDIPKLDYLSGEIEELWASTDLGYYVGDYFKAGKKYKGIPYARADKDSTNWGYNTFKVGIYIDFETFITAVMNKNSIIDKESVGNAATHNACFYATVCSAMVCHALGLPYYSTASFPSITGMTNLGLVSAFNLANLKLGDVLVETSIHTAIVTDVVIENGVVKFIEVSEAAPMGNDNNNSINIGEGYGEYGGVCRRRWWNITDFLANWSTYTVLRYSLIGNVTYTPSPYVQIGDEVEQPANHIMAVMPYTGNKFAYHVGKIVNNDILINATGFSNMRVTKDGVAWNENGTTDYYDITGLSKISIGFTDVGEYIAYLCNVSGSTETKKTKACKWSVIN